MNEHMPLERLVAGWMADEAAGAPEALLDEILATTAGTRPQPTWRARLAEPTLRRSGRTAVGLPNRGLAFATIALLLLAALVALVVGATLRQTRPPSPSSEDWPGFRGAADRSGVAIKGPVGNPVTLWTIHNTGAVLEVSVIGDRAYFASDDGRLHGVSRVDGSEAWSVAVAEPPLSGPFAADGRLYLSDASGRFLAFSQADGALDWLTTTTYVTPSRAVSADGTLYFGTGDGFLVALDGATGAERWRVQPKGATRVDAPAVGDGRVFAGTAGAGFVAIDLVSHEVAWIADTTVGENTGSASVIDGIAYIGTGADSGSVGTLHAFDATTGAPRWTATESFLALPTVANGVTFSVTTHGLIAAIDTASGRTIWNVQLEGDLRSPVVVGGTLYVVASSAHRIVAVDAATGDELWSYELEGNPNCCLSVAKGAVFVGDQSGAVYAIGGDGAAITARPFPSVEASPGPTPSATIGPTPAPLPSFATVDWTTDLRGMGFAPISQIAVDPQGRIWAPEAEADKIAIFDPSGTLIEEWGEPGDRPGQFDFTRGNGDGYGSLAFASDGSFYVLDVGNRRVQHFDAKRRYLEAWSGYGHDPGQFIDPVGIVVAADDTVWILDDVRSVVEHYTADGNVLGSFDPFAVARSTNGANSLAIGPSGDLYVTSVDPYRVLVFDPSGTLLRTVGDVAFAEQPTQMAIDADGRLFVSQGPQRGTAPGVLVFAADSTLIGGFGPLGGGDGELAFPGGIALDGAGGLYVEDSLQGTARLMRLQLESDLAPSPAP